MLRTLTIIHKFSIKISKLIVILTSLSVVIIVPFSVILRYLGLIVAPWWDECARFAFYWLLMAALPLSLQASSPKTVLSFRTLIAITFQLLVLMTLGIFGLVVFFKTPSIRQFYSLPISTIWRDAALLFGCFVACISLMNRLINKG
jgi:TRAP-type C4-dicarboxylate transport system permease small subunit